MKFLVPFAGFLALSLVATTANHAFAQNNWKPANGPLMTRWAKEVSPTNVLPEYPRPQLARANWLNLNGLWQYQPGEIGDAVPSGAKLSSQILVPFPVESALSGVMEHHDRLWYKRDFTVPAAWNGQRLKLNFGAVDYEAEIYVNGESVGIHRGGYEPFSLDITDHLKGNGPQELIVRVFDATDKAGEPRGKQTLNPGGIMYTPATGIWQTVWLEPVSRTSIQGIHMVPDIDRGTLKFTATVDSATPTTVATVQIKDKGKLLRTVVVKPGVEVSIPMPRAILWSPENPFLYDVAVTLRNGKQTVDQVSSYFGMRKISLAKVNGITRIMLNNQAVFNNGPLDQGYWPDGIYTAPTDEALKFDIIATKQLGFNMTRKHIKVEPARWYYHADKLGLMVWQDMPSPNSYLSGAPPVNKAAFEKQIGKVIEANWNSPAIVSWVMINEGQGAYDEPKFVAIAKKFDDSRLINRHSGGGNDGPPKGEIGEIDDVHIYPAPGAPNPSPNQAIVVGEYGGIGFPIKDHMWKAENWGYTKVSTPRELEEQYGEYMGMLKQLRDEKGLSDAVYTQITDVEIETNGLLTYDRIFKTDPKEIARANRFEYPQPTYLPLAAVSVPTPQTSKTTTATPPDNWAVPGFDDSNWTSAPGAFGGAMEGGPKITTSWESNDIWLRRTFEVGNLSAAEIDQLVLRQYHDDGIEIYINGVLAYRNGDAVHDYINVPISAEAKAAIKPNAINVLAVHCHENFGDQHVDVGLYRRVPARPDLSETQKIPLSFYRLINRQWPTRSHFRPTKSLFRQPQPRRALEA